MFQTVGIAPRRHRNPLPSYNGNGRIAVGADSGARVKHCTDARDDIAITQRPNAREGKPLENSAWLRCNSATGKKHAYIVPIILYRRKELSVELPVDT